MNKKILLGIVALAIAGVSVVNVNFNSRSNKLSGVSLANVEALAQESGGSSPCVPTYCCQTQYSECLSFLRDTVGCTSIEIMLLTGC